MYRLVKLKDLGMGLVPYERKGSELCFRNHATTTQRAGERNLCPWGSYTLLENTIAYLNVHIVEAKVEHFCN